MALKKPVKFGLFVIGAFAALMIGKTIVEKTTVGKQLAAKAKGSAAASASIVDKIGGVEALNVCVNTWGGFAGGQYFNGGFKASEQSRYYQEYKLPVNFIKIDDDTYIDAWKSDKCQVAYTTVDAFTTRINALQDEDPRIFFQADYSRGGDVLVASASVRSVKDLRGKKVAFWKGTPSHTLILKALEASGMTENDITVIATKDAFDAKKVFQSGEADAAAVWSPDDQDLIGPGGVPGAHVLFSTKQATHIIADAFFAKQSFIESHQQELAAFVEGWMKGAAAVSTDPQAKEDAVKILTAGLEMPEDFIRTAIGNAYLSTYGDNVNFFNLKGGYTGVTGKTIWDDMSRKFRTVGMVDGQVPDWSKVVNTSVLRAVTLSGAEQAGEAVQHFDKATAEVRNAEAFASKALTIEFPTGSAELTEDAKITIDTSVTNTVRGFQGARIRIEGNTDNQGSDNVNVPLSRRRAQAVANYLIQKFGYDPNRFIVLGNGAANPVGDNSTAEGRQRNRRTELQLIK